MHRTLIFEHRFIQLSINSQVNKLNKKSIFQAMKVLYPIYIYIYIF